MLGCQGDVEILPKFLGLLGPIWNEADGIILPEALGESDSLFLRPLNEPNRWSVFQKTAASVFTLPRARPRTLPPLPPHQEVDSISSPLDLGRAFLIVTKNKIWQK